MFRRVLVGAAAGAAATTALNAVTYADMAWRGRPESSTPQETVEKLVAKLDVSVPGEGDTRSNRLFGLGALSGIAMGVGVGVAYGVLDALHVRPSLLVGGVAAGAAAMAASDASMARLGVTDPSTWSPQDWASDAVPHLVFGLVLAATFRAAGHR